MENKRVLMLATSHKTRGGVTAVVNAYTKCDFWKAHQVDWLETHIDKSKGMKFWYAARAFARYLMIVSRYDIIHIHTSELPSVRRKLPFLRVAKAKGKKVVVHLHIGNQLEENRGNAAYVELFREADAIIVLSRSIQEKLETLFGIKDKVYVIYNPCPILSRPASYSDVQKEIIFAGTLNANKDYTTLIRAFAKVASRFPDWRLTIAGNGEMEKARGVAREEGVDKVVRFPGWVRGDEKDRLFRNASLFCLTSHAEGFPMAVLDAWAYGLPVVSTPVGGLPDVLRTGENVLFFEPGDVEGLAERLDQVLADPDLRHRLSGESLKLAGGLFSLDYINGQIEDLYKSLY